MKIGLIDCGGGYRDIYAAGVTDYMIDNGIKVDVALGVSAGSTILANYIAEDRKKNYRIIAHHMYKPDFVRLSNIIKCGEYMNLRYLFNNICVKGGAESMDVNKIKASPTELYIVSTDAEKGTPVYFTKDDLEEDDLSVISASSAIPLAARPREIKGRIYYDAAVSDNVPIKKALKLGCDKIILILSKPKHIIRSPKRDLLTGFFIKWRFPNSAKTIATRAERYNEAVAYAKELEKEGRVLIVSPDSSKIRTLNKDANELQVLYDKGYRDAEAIKDFLS